MPFIYFFVVLSRHRLLNANFLKSCRSFVGDRFVCYSFTRAIKREHIVRFVNISCAHTDISKLLSEQRQLTHSQTNNNNGVPLCRMRNKRKKETNTPDSRVLIIIKFIYRCESFVFALSFRDIASCVRIESQRYERLLLVDVCIS